MAWIWNRILPKAMRAVTTPSARIDNYIAGKIQPDGPGLALAVVKAGSVVHAAGYGLAGRAGPRLQQKTIFSPGQLRETVYRPGIAMLAEEGKLHLDDPVAKHLPCSPPSARRSRFAGCCITPRGFAISMTRTISRPMPI